MHKIGKTDKVVELDDCLIMQTEDGAEMYDCMRWDITTANKVLELAAILKDAKSKLPPDKKYVYKYGVIDTVDQLEEIAIRYCTWDYNRKITVETDKVKKVQTITDLPYGQGHGYVRDTVINWINGFAGAFEHLILLGHVRDKEITSKEGFLVTSKDLGLMGKMAQILCARMDTIAYAYRNLKGELRLNFQTNELSPTMGSRFSWLAGRDIPWEWNYIFDPEAVLRDEASGKLPKKAPPVVAPPKPVAATLPTQPAAATTPAK